LELCHDHLRVLALPQETDTPSNQQVQACCIPWRHEARLLDSEAGQRELTAALKQAAADLHLAGQTVSIAMGADFCVTRVITGSEPHIQQELAQLAKRSALYLLLGRGEKVMASVVHSLDARHQHALVAVSSRNVLDAVLSASDAAGLRIDRIEPSSIALSRCANHHEAAEANPALMLSLDRGSVDMAITYRGRLVLDYRPGGESAADDIPDLVARHLARLQRYCSRYHWHAEGRIEKIFLCGPREITAPLQEPLARRTSLAVEFLSPQKISPRSSFSAEAENPVYCAALGICLVDAEEDALAGPNLKLASSASDPPRLAAFARWTAALAAAMILFMVGFWGLAFWGKTACRNQEQQLARLESRQQQVTNLRNEIVRGTARIKHLRMIEAAVPERHWPSTLENVAHCLPTTTWLEGLEFSEAGRITLDGISLESGDAYTFAAWLSKAPGFTRTYVEGTRPLRLSSGEATAFKIETKISEFNDHESHHEDSD